MNRIASPLLRLIVLAGIPLTIATLPVFAQESADSAEANEPTVLFDVAEPLAITIATDLRTVLRDIDSLERQEHVATLSYTNASGEVTTLDVQVRTRGHYRRQRGNCNFPPLRVNVKKGQVAGTVFQNQDKIKLVTHCQSGRDEYEQNVLKEYLVYRWFNRLSDASHRVRLAHITYQDTTGREDTLVRYGFFIEDEDELADRLGGEITTDPLHPATMNFDLMGIVDVFQYMIGNTDWSVVGQHNLIVIRTPNDFFPIPYDFDWSGVVNARYAEPDARLRLRSVRDRLYRGSCRSAEDFARLFQWYHTQRDLLYGEVEALTALNDRNRRATIEYLDDFFDVLDNPRDARREFMNRCS